jgi:hypothetical protein
MEAPVIFEESCDEGIPIGEHGFYMLLVLEVLGDAGFCRYGI